MPDKAVVGNGASVGRLELEGSSVGEDLGVKGEAKHDISVRVWFFGMIRQLTGERDVALTVPCGSTVADVLTALIGRFGSEFRDQIMRVVGKKSCCRVSLDGYLVKDLATPVGAGTGAATVEIIVLSAQEGG